MKSDRQKFHVSLKPTAAVFRLKRNHKNRITEEYAGNLIGYGLE